jgi:hypothetical protein
MSSRVFEFIIRCKVIVLIFLFQECASLCFISREGEVNEADDSEKRPCLSLLPNYNGQ